MTTNKLRRDLAEITRLIGSPDACRDCRGVEYIGMPGLFVYLYVPRKVGERGSGTHRHGTPEEFERYFDGCPTCGEPVKTYPIIMKGLAPRPDIPDPWPVNQWPEIPDHLKRNRDEDVIVRQ